MRLAARFILPAITSLALIGLGSVAIAKAEPTVVQHVQALFTDATASPSPSPTPTPTLDPALILPSPVPTSVPTPPPPPPPPAVFPHTQGPTGTVNGQPTEVPVPQTNVFINIQCTVQPCTDPSTGGIICTAPCTLIFTADFQGGFPGITPIFTWSTGDVGQVVTITFNTAGKPVVTVIADETYQGIKYEVASIKAVPITVQ